MMQTEQELTFDELKKEFYYLKRRVYASEKRHKESMEIYERFLRLQDRILRRPSKILTNSDKVTCVIILKLLMLGNCEQKGTYSRILLEEVQELNGNTARADSTIDRLINRKLFDRATFEHVDGEYWLAIPDDFMARLLNIPSEFKRNWHTPWCNECGKNVKAHRKTIGVTVLVCDRGHVLQDLQGIKMDMSMEGFNKETTTVDEALQGIQQLREEYEVL